MILVCGEALFDFFHTAGGEPPARLNYQAVAGGSPFNVAIGLARLGVAASYLGGISNDVLGCHLVEVLTKERVHLDYLQRFDAPTTLAMVALDAEGTPQYDFRGVGCADRALSCKQLPVLAPQVRTLHVGSFSLVVEPVGQALRELVARESSQRLISLDPNVRFNAQPDVQAWRQHMETLVGHAHLIKASDEDLAALYPGATFEAIAERWLKGPACQLVFVTRGAQGAQVFSRAHGQVAIEATPIQMADTVGAGDTFQAAVLTWLTEHGFDTPSGLSRLQPAQLKALLKFAVAAAALTCSKVGPDLPYRHDLKDFA